MALLRAGLAVVATCVTLGQVAAGSLLSATDARTSKVRVEIFYEALCPFCERLFNASFRKIWEDAEFRERVDLTLLPFGNARVTGRRRLEAGYLFWHPDASNPTVRCQHGEQECLGNEIQSCAIDLIGTREAASLVLCMAGQNVQGYGIEKASYECMEELHIDRDKVKQCLGSRRSSRMTIRHGRRSTRRSLKRKYVPWVMMNGRHEELDEEHDLVRPLCAAMRSPKPALCSQARLTVPTSGVSLSALEGTAPPPRRAGEVCWQEEPEFEDGDAELEDVGAD